MKNITIFKTNIFKSLISIIFSLVLVTQETGHSQSRPPLNSPFLSSPEIETSILNVHSVGVPNLLRGMEPRENISEFLNLGITDVIIFKPPALKLGGRRKSVQDPMEQEIQFLKQHRIKYQQIPMPWKDITNFTEVCNYTIQALKYIVDIRISKDRTLFFHCTVGEDRTGALAGLVRILDGWPLERAFHQEMCLYGYEHGNPFKNFPNVVCPIRESLTPFFLKMVQKIQKGQLSWGILSKEQLAANICNDEELLLNPQEFTCEVSKARMSSDRTEPIAPVEDCR